MKKNKLNKILISGLVISILLGASITTVTVADSLTVTISANPVKITAGQGEPVTLSWSSTGATDASIEGIGKVATSGSQIVYPTKTTTYTITAINSVDGTMAYASTTVTVNTGPSFTIYITDPKSSSDSSIFTVGDPFTISGGPTNVNDYSIARITSSGGEENLGAPGVLSGSFSPNDVGLWKVWVSGTKNNPMTSNPIYFAVLPQPKLTPSTQGTSTYCYISKDPTQYFELHVDKTLLIPGSNTDATSTVTLTYSLGNWPSYPKYVCHVTDNQKYDATSNLTFYVTSTDQYSFDCQQGSTWNPNANSVCTTTKEYANGRLISLPSTNKNFIYIRVFGGAAGGMQEVAPFSQ